MLKKLALAVALCVTASFATWDYFPVLENHKGEVKVGAFFDKAGDWKDLNLFGAARFTVVPNLELGVLVPFQVMEKYDSEDGTTGLRNSTMMLRYQFMPSMRAFLDVKVPDGKEKIDGDATVFYFGAQYSQKFDFIDFGSELGLEMETKGDDKVTPPWKLKLGVEADFIFESPLLPFVGVEMDMEIGKWTVDGSNEGENHTGHVAFWPYAGAVFYINEMLSVDGYVSVGVGNEHIIGEDTPIYVTGSFNIAF